MQEPLPTIHAWQHAWDQMELDSAGRYWHELVAAHRSVGLLTTVDTGGHLRDRCACTEESLQYDRVATKHTRFVRFVCSTVTWAE